MFTTGVADEHLRYICTFIILPGGLWIKAADPYHLLSKQNLDVIIYFLLQMWMFDIRINECKRRFVYLLYYINL